jgi:D-alanyl-lipoteichoic acid acyltransferase DltB (MBOAT superfamily)
VTFNSAEFVLFALVIGAMYIALNFSARTHRLQNLMLLAASYFFYGLWDHRFLFLIVFSTAVDFVCGLGVAQRRMPLRSVVALLVMMVISCVVLLSPVDWAGIAGALAPAELFVGDWTERPVYQGVLLPDGSWLNLIGALSATGAYVLAFGLGGLLLRGDRQRRYFLVVSMATNLALLGFFKYYDFFVGSAAELLVQAGLGQHDWEIGIIVPVGISFYTFQSMSYAIDVYRRQMEPTEDLVDFALAVAFFPHMVAGPIQRAHSLLDQLVRHRPFDWQHIQVGTYLIGWGLFKKIFIADNLARLVVPAFDASAPSGPQVLFGVYAFALQIYCDFSGYTDIARGLSRLMGVELMINFNIPYAATNPSEFWRRWHISLSTWLRDYLYIPLGGNQGTAKRILRNLMLTMALGGLWHGARANFVLWGVYQGLLLCAHRAAKPWLDRFRPTNRLSQLVWTGVCWLGFFHVVCYGWLLFRADSYQSIELMTRSLTVGWSSVSDYVGILGRIAFYGSILGVVEAMQLWTGNQLVALTWPWPVRSGFYTAMFYLAVVFGSYDAVEFIYFQF